MGKLFPSPNFSVFGFDLPDWVKSRVKLQVTRLNIW
jgi:hypothetical protein